MSTPSAERRAIWRVFLECGYALIDILDAELQAQAGMTLRWYDEAGLVERQRPREDRRAIEVVMTPSGADALRAARTVHRRGIEEHFAQHLDDHAFAGLLDALRPVHEHVRPLRPGRVSGRPPEGPTRPASGTEAS